MWQYDLVNYHIYRVNSQLFTEFQMLLLIYEVLFYYEIIYFDINIKILYISLKYVVNIISFIVTYLSCVLIGYSFWIFNLFYFISILIPK